MYSSNSRCNGCNFCLPDECSGPSRQEEAAPAAQPARDDHGDHRRQRDELVYGRPYTLKAGTSEARKIWGGLVPYGKVWRTGADEATLLTTAKPIKIGGNSLAPGTYSLFTIPNEDGTAKLVINKKTGQWGIPYDEAKEKDNELARVDLRKTDLDKPVDQFTMAIESQPGGGGELKMMWEKTQYSVLFTVASVDGPPPGPKK
jgi:Protein of unknown function (DUF2911)